MDYLAFVDEIGRTVDGGYMYRFDYAEDSEIVWGEYFNSIPAINVPNLQPDINCLSKTERVECKQILGLAKTNGCFSMQDCIDGIIALCFSEIGNNTLYYKDTPLLFRFGEEIDEVHEKMASCGIVSLGIEEVKKGGDEIIDALIDTLGDE